MFVFMVLVIVIEHGVAEVVVEVTVHAMDVVSTVLSVVIFDEECGALNEIVMWLTRL